MLVADKLSLMRDSRPILSGLSACFLAGRISLLVGPNGAGKSTLLSALAGDHVPASGQLCLDGTPLHRMPLAGRARRRAVLPQQASVAFAFPVRALVAMGLHPFGIAPDGATGRALVDGALAAMDLDELADRPATAISGGEAQRAHLARVLVQVEGALGAGLSPLLLLDEPATGLDWRHQFALVRLLHALAARGVAIIASLHDLPLARALGGDVMLLAEGRLQATGPVGDVLAPPLLARWFGIEETEARLLAA